MTSKRLLTLLAVAFLSCFCAYGQRDLGTITGTISDASGAAVGNAKVTITEVATGLVYDVVTSEGGEYIRPLLKPGIYTITVEAPGFRRSQQQNVEITAGGRVGVSLTLSIGDVNQAIEVSASAPLLQTESTVIGAAIGSKSVSELPLGGQRTFTYLARLSPGVVPSEPGARDSVNGGFSANGVRSNGQNNFLLNGVDNNVNVIDFLNQTAYVIGPSVDAIGEMQILTSGYNAEYGRGAGGVVNVLIKSGSNQLHGTVFEFLQNDKLNANRWERNRSGNGRGPLKQNQFGGTLGGPIKRNRTFIFGDYQGTRIASTGGSIPGLGVSQFFTIPTLANRNGDFSNLLGAQIGTDPLGRPILQGQIYDPQSVRTVNGQLVRDPFPGNRIPASRFDPAAKKIVDLFPAPNFNVANGVGFQQNNFFTTTSGSSVVDQGDVRVDHKITDKDSIFGSLSWSEVNKVNGAPLPGALDATYFNSAAEETKARNAMISYARVWTPAFISETRVGFTRLVTARTQALPEVDQFTAFGIRGYNPSGPLNGGLPSINIDRYSGVGASDWLPSKEYSNVLSFIQNVSLTRGGHAYKAGVELRSIKFPFFQFPNPHGNLQFNRRGTSYPDNANSLAANTGDGLASFLLGEINTGSLSTTNFISSQKAAYAFFVQDDWKVTPKLTVSLGLRYELFSPIAERFGRQSNFDINTQTLYIPKGKDQDAPLPPNFAQTFPQVKVSRGEVDKYLIPWDKTNFGPRIGLAYAQNNKTVFRAGYGIFYGGEENQGGSPNRGESVPFNATVQFNRNNGDFAPADFLTTLSNGFPVNTFTLPAQIQFRAVATNFRNPLVHKWNIAVQRELGANTALEVSYIGNHQAHQMNNTDANGYATSSDPNIPVNSLRPYPNLGGVSYTSTFGFGNYAGLATKLEKRFSQGMSVLAQYTYGHALSSTNTTLSGSAGFGPKDPRNYSGAYSSASWDIRHSTTTAFLYELPFGRGKRFGTNWSGPVNAIAGNWQLNSILTFRTGSPFTLGTNAGVGRFNVFTPDVVPGKDPKAAPAGGRSADKWFDTSAVTAPRPGTSGNLGLQSNNAPGQRNVDLSLFKDFRFTERIRLQYRAEAFNLGNTPQFDRPNNTQGDPAFGTITATQPGSERKIQMALRLNF